MYKKLVINVTPHETRVALLEDENIVELFIERNNDSNIVGNIYKGHVQRVLPGMQAAFIDIGLDHAAFICADDVSFDNVSDIELLFDETEGESFEIIETQEDDNSQNELQPPKKPRYLIEEMLTENQEILVQVSKAPMGSKGACVTSHISLPGRFLVLMPTSNHIGVSRRIEEESERKRLKDLVTGLRKNSFGYIVRTAAEGVEAEKLAFEMNFLINLWQNIQNKYKIIPSTSLIHQELSIVLRAVRDLLTHEADKLIIDSRQGYASILSFLDEFMPSLKETVEFYDGIESIFDAHNLEGDISRALKKKVWLKSGGYIIIEQTEALVAIDVNTGRYVGKYNLEETILKTNLEAVKEIAYQIRLRDLSGIIIIDFIDMEKPANQEKVFNALKEALKRDKSKTHVLPISEMGLVQMTRKRIRKPLSSMICEPCFYCDGEGLLLSKQSICYNLEREARRQTQDMIGSRLTLRVNPDIAELLHGEENHIILNLEKRLQKQIVIYPNPDFHLEQFDLIEIIKE